MYAFITDWTVEKWQEIRGQELVNDMQQRSTAELLLGALQIVVITINL